MKKILSLLSVVLILFSMSLNVFAGDIPESLLSEDIAQVYFGEVKSISEESITVIQKQNIKGKFEQEKEYTYTEFYFPCIVKKGDSYGNSTKTDTLDLVKVGNQYLFGGWENSNHLYIWEVSSFDTKTLKILNIDDFGERMQMYLNEGQFEEKEQERLEKINKAETSSTSVIGGADAPTDIIIKSNINIAVVVCIGVFALAFIIGFIYKKRKNKK